jgi:hypothetical protein
MLKKLWGYFKKGREKKHLTPEEREVQKWLIIIFLLLISAAILVIYLRSTLPPIYLK